MMDADHIHTNNCWRSLEKECVEFHNKELEMSIIFWRGLAVKVQAALRVAKGQIDKIENEVTRAIKDER